MDQTKALLRIFNTLTKTIGLRVTIRPGMSTRMRGAFNHHIGYLAEVRNQAFNPLYKLQDLHNEYFFDTIVFTNDILPCSITEDLGRRVNICTKLVLLDEDDTIKDLAIKTIEELWFQNMPSQIVLPKGKPPSSSNTQDKAALLSKVSVIIGMSAYFKDK